MATVEETKQGGKQAYGTHNYPDPLTNIDKNLWDVVVVGAGPAGLMLTVSSMLHRMMPEC
jgi:NADPH-dependent 2,4-dienoyl-CoA reductase/sulfur reductase-like enzyme